MTHQPNEQESREEIHKIFIMFDVFKTGTEYQNIGKIGLRELRKISKELGELTDDSFLQEMIARGDTDGDEMIS